MLPFVSLSVCPSDAPGSKWCILCCGYYKTLEFCLIYWREKIHRYSFLNLTVKTALKTSIFDDGTYKNKLASFFIAHDVCVNIMLVHLGPRSTLGPRVVQM